MEVTLRRQNFVALGKQAWQERQNISDGGHRKHRLEGHGIGALVEDNDVAVTITKARAAAKSPNSRSANGS